MIKSDGGAGRIELETLTRLVSLTAIAAAVNPLAAPRGRGEIPVL